MKLRKCKHDWIYNVGTPVAYRSCKKCSGLEIYNPTDKKWYLGSLEEVIMRQRAYIREQMYENNKEMLAPLSRIVVEQIDNPSLR